MLPVAVMARQLQLAATQASTSLARLAIDVYGTVPAFNALGASVALAGVQAQATQASVEGLTGSLAAVVPALEQTNASLQQTVAVLDQMQALNWLSEALLRVEGDAGRAQQAIDDTMLPAFDRAYAGFFDLADAAIGFQRTVADVLSSMSSATVIVPAAPTITVGTGVTGGTTGTAAGGAATPSWLAPPAQDQALQEYYRGISKGVEEGGELVDPIVPLLGPKVGPVVGGAGRAIGGAYRGNQVRVERAERQRRESFRYMDPRSIEASMHNIQSTLRHREDAMHGLEQARHNVRVARRGGPANAEMVQQRTRELREAESRVTWDPDDTIKQQEDYKAFQEAQAYQRNRATRPPQPRLWSNEELYGPDILRYPLPERPGAPAAGTAPGAPGAAATAGVSVTAGTTGSVVAGSPVVVDMQIARNRMPTSRREVPARPEIPGRAGRDALRGFQDEARDLISLFEFAERRGTSTDPAENSLRDLHGRITAAMNAEGVSTDLEAGLSRLISMMEHAVPELEPLPQIRAVPALAPMANTVPFDPENFRARTEPFTPKVPPPPKSTFDVLRETLGEAGRAFYQTVASAAGTMVGDARGLAGNVGDAFGKGWGGMSGAKEIGAQQVTSSASAFTGLLSSFTPLGVVATLLQGVFEGLAPLIESLKEPLRIVGSILGAALAPILKALFPVFKGIAIGATWVGQIFFTVAGGIAKVVGSLIKGLGKLIDKIPGMSDMGLKKTGQDMIDMGKGFSESAKALEKGREEIKNLEFGETAQAAEQANEAMRNVPEGFKIALARFNVSTPAAVSGPAAVSATQPAISTASVPVYASDSSVAVQSAPVTIQQVHIASDNPEKIWAQLKDVMERENLRHSGNPMAFAM